MATKHLGDFYNKTNFWQTDRWQDLVDLAMATPMNPEKVTKWVDVGCGTGKLTKSLLEVFQNTERGVGIDISATMLETARKENTDPRITYLEMKAEGFDVLGETFDLAHSNFALHWVKDKAAFFESLNKSVPVGGYLMLGTCQKLPDMLMDIDAFLRKAFGIADSVEGPFHYHDMLGWAEVLRKYGWEIEAAQTKYDQHYTGDAKEFLQHWVSASSQKICYGRWFDDLSDAQKDELLATMLEKYRYEDEESFIFNEQTLLIIAKRVK